MSHVTVMKGLVITDEGALISAINELIANGVNGEIRRNSTVRGHTQSDVRQMGTCDIVFRLSDTSYDVGFKKNAKGEFEPMMDIYGNKVGSQLGINPSHEQFCEMPDNWAESGALRQLGKLSQMYAKHAALNQAAAEGYTVDSISVDPRTGELNLLLNVA